MAKRVTLTKKDGEKVYPRTYTKLVQNGDGEILDNIMLTSAKILPFSGYEVGLNDAALDAVAPSGYTINYNRSRNMFFAVVDNVNYSNWGNAEQLLYNRGYTAREDNVYIHSNGNICVIQNGSMTTVSTVGTQLAEVKADIDAFLLDADASSAAIDTLKEIQSYIDSDKESAAAMLASIQANATAIATETERAISEEERIEANLSAESIRAIKAEEVLRDKLTELVNGKVDVVEGKSLIDNVFATHIPSVISANADSKYMLVEIDEDDKILGGRKTSGTKFENMPIEVPSCIFNYENNPEWESVFCDSEGRILNGVRSNGKTFIPFIDSPQLYENIYSNVITYINDKISEVLQNINTWKDKTIVWLGTSIPATGYPQLVGQLLEANVTNESQGSSMCRMGRATKGDAFGDDIGCSGVAWQNIVLSLSLSQEEKLRIFKRWTTDNRKALMISEDGYTAEQVADVVGYGNLMAGSFAGEDGHPSGLPSSKPIDFMYEGYVNARKLCYECSWDNSVDIEEGFGVINGKVEKYLNEESFPDVWVFDHGHNDGLGVDNETIDTIPSDPLDRSYFLGASNFIFSKILRYNPHATIILIGHYTDNSLGTNYPVKVTKGQENLADYWQFPLIKAWELLPFSPSSKVTTTGYYDSVGTWHNTGYDGSPSYQHSAGYDEITNTNQSSDFMGSNHYGGHYSGGNNNVRQIDGVWVHDLTMKQIWMRDDLHPDNISKPLYAKSLSCWLKSNILL